MPTPSRFLTQSLNWLTGKLAMRLLWLLQKLGAERASNLGARVLGSIGRFIPHNKIGYANLKAAFPEKSEGELRQILKGVWENLGRTCCEYAAMDELWDYDAQNPNQGRITLNNPEIFAQLAHDGKPALIFTAHLANWELPAVAAAAQGLDVAALFRMPNNPYVARGIFKLRRKNMGKLIPAGRMAPLALARVLETGSHVGMLIDQRLSKGEKVMFFGRECTVNPTFARLARQFECPVHGVRVIRQGGTNFYLEATEAIDLPRDETGKIAIQPTMQLLTTHIEGWIRENPEQWLWLHRRWR
jgi:Kdo2-lipid IVA lauroyltransferase/acyltransferase